MATASMPIPSTRSRTPMLALGFHPDCVPYERGLELQAEAVDRIEQGLDRGTVLLLEHPPVYTAGRRAEPDEYPSDGSPVVAVDRGGRVTWHGPGQLVCYPVVRLRSGAGVVDFVRALETAIIDTVAAFGVSGTRVEGRSGVWVTHPDRPPTKLAQIGLHARGGIITHGIAINCCNDLEPFSRIVPCGIPDAGVTTLSALAGRRIPPEIVAPDLQVHLAHVIAEFTA